jgi:hypothetical protein
MNNIDLTDIERAFLDKSANLEVTRSRRLVSILLPLALILVVVLVPPIKHSPQLLLSLLIAYLVVAALERLAYANAVLVYKSLIQKLSKRIESLEGNGS